MAKQCLSMILTLVLACTAPVNVFADGGAYDCRDLIERADTEENTRAQQLILEQKRRKLSLRNRSFCNRLKQALDQTEAGICPGPDCPGNGMNPASRSGIGPGTVRAIGGVGGGPFMSENLMWGLGGALLGGLVGYMIGNNNGNRGGYGPYGPMPMMGGMPPPMFRPSPFMPRPMPMMPGYGPGIGGYPGGMGGFPIGAGGLAMPFGAGGMGMGGMPLGFGGMPGGMGMGMPGMGMGMGGMPGGVGTMPYMGGMPYGGLPYGGGGMGGVGGYPSALPIPGGLGAGYGGGYGGGMPVGMGQPNPPIVLPFPGPTGGYGIRPFSADLYKPMLLN